ncbi:WXG100 family type VII secretion target [Ktedonobacteria bacterium brp13]|jgi:WXG100 family type VII secretion target|nr:WXG100 family type VII secretion target [Ktedonobacteria bacterium brp13]
MPDIRANTVGIQTGASKFSQQSVELGDLLTTVSGTIDELQSLWTGPAASQFVDLMSEWSKDVNDIKQVLETIATKVHNAGLGYDDLDGQIQRAFRF